MQTKEYEKYVDHKIVRTPVAEHPEQNEERNINFTEAKILIGEENCGRRTNEEAIETEKCMVNFTRENGRKTSNTRRKPIIQKIKRKRKLKTI